MWRVLLWSMTAIAVADTLYLAWLWPDWRRLASGPIPQSQFMRTFEARQRTERHPIRLDWHPVSRWQLPRSLKRAVVVAEDCRFYSHHGIDFEAIGDALRYDWEAKRFAYGASTISQQTVKNLFLSADRSPLRKWHELVLTLAMEAHLSKQRILELYLNDAEFGPGIYGAEAAAEHYWGIPASDLDLEQSIELAATLPDPREDNPRSRTRAFIERRDKILHNMDLLIQPNP